jgi:hypothetical protein
MLIETGQSVERDNEPFGLQLFKSDRNIFARFEAAKRELIDLAGIDSETVDSLWGLYATQSLDAVRAVKRITAANPSLNDSLVPKARNRRGLVGGFNFASKFMKGHFGISRLVLRKIDRPMIVNRR